MAGDEAGYNNDMPRLPEMAWYKSRAYQRWPSQFTHRTHARTGGHTGG